MRAIFMLLALLCAPAHARDGVYLDLGAGWAQGLIEDLHLQEQRVDWSPKFHAQVEIGYKLGDWAIFAQHTSSPITTHDQGVDVVGIRRRFWLSD